MKLPTLLSLGFLTIQAAECRTVKALSNPDSLQMPLESDSNGSSTSQKGCDINVAQENPDLTHTRPFYAIAHRVLDKEAVDAAIKHGANALEIDVMPYWKGKGAPGWWADHDGDPVFRSWGDKTDVLFRHIAERASQGHNIVFVWLDFKKPNFCDPYEEGRKWYDCSVMRLQDEARSILLPAGVRVMYGMYNAEQVEDGACKQLTSRSVNQSEALNIDGNFKDVVDLFERQAPKPETRQRVMSTGLFEPWLHSKKILNQLTQGVQSKYFGRVFGWTVTGNHHIPYAIDWVNEAGVDGVIYGRAVNVYREKESEDAAGAIKEVIQRSPGIHVAQRKDNEWPW